LTIQLCHDKEALSLAAAGLFAEQARAAVKARGRFGVLLSGGETPRRCYELLAQEPFAGSIPWHGVQLFWGDERYVPQDHPLSNFGMVRRALLDRVTLGASQIHPVPYLPTPQESALAYERELRGFFGADPPSFDLALLGLGEDGHTASLLPGSEVLAERQRWVREVYHSGQGIYRVSVTLPLLNQAALVAFLVEGSAKSAMLRRVLEGGDDQERVPAQLVAPVKGQVLWLADREAARLLSGEMGRQGN
jgi:6-phosphogluconolactonase